MKRFGIGVGLFVFLGLGCAQQVRHTHHDQGLSPDTRQYLSKKVRGGLPSFDIPIEVNNRVIQEMRRLVEMRERFGRYLARSGRYEIQMKKTLREEGLPEDLFYLAMIESGFSTFALSRASALGPWQFIRSTGRHFGLQQTGWLDERKDFEKSTRAAARYLKSLYKEFGDWYLAMAAYNAGEGRIRGAIRKAGTDDYWALTAPGTRYLKRETQDYVPRIIAAAILAKMPESFGFRNIPYEAPYRFDTVRVRGPLDLAVAAELVNVEVGDLVMLNPELNRTATPPGHYSLRIPEGSHEQFELAYADLPEEKRQVEVAAHRVARGDNIGKIAKRYHVSTGALISANNLNKHQSRYLKVGQKLVIPGGKEFGSALSALGSVDIPTNTVTTYKVRKGDTLLRVASRFGTNTATLKRLNHIKGNTLRAGQKLKVRELASEEVSGMAFASASAVAQKHEKVNGVEWLIRADEDLNAPAALEDLQETVAAELAEPIGQEVLSSTENPRSEEGQVIALEEKETSVSEETFVLEDQPSVEEAIAAITIEPRFGVPQVKEVALKPAIHSVRRGENLWTIARKYPGVSTRELKEWNRLSGNKIRTGQKLYLTAANPVVRKKSNRTTPEEF